MVPRRACYTAQLRGSSENIDREIEREFCDVLKSLEFTRPEVAEVLHRAYQESTAGE
jgi:hypothetical protein